jgi:hypothetical protein
VRTLLGEPDRTVGPFSLQYGTITSRDPKTGETTTEPATTHTTATSTWEYRRPTSEAPQFVYTVEFDHDIVISLSMDRRPGAPSTSNPAP